jgi:hypothetical protein
MRRIIVMCALVGAMAGCETKGVVVSEYSRGDGGRVRLEQYNRDQKFFYSLSASLEGRGEGNRGLAKGGTRACKLPEWRITAMGSGGLLSLRLRTERSSCV